MILNKYIYREVLLAFVAVLSILLLVYISHRFVRYLAEAVAGTIPVDVIVKLLGLQLLRKLEIFMPIAFYLAVLLSLGRLYKDNEVTAMNACGIGLMTIVGNVFRMSLFFAGLTMIFSLYVSPQVMSIQNEYKEEAKDKTDITGIYPGQFREFRKGKRVVYVEEISIDKRRMKNVFIQVREKDSSDIVVAENAYQTVDEERGRRFIVLEDGSRYAGWPGELDFAVTRFKRYMIHVEEKGPGNDKQRYRIDTMTTKYLMNNFDDPRHAAELQWRFSIPLSLVVLSLLAVVLARTSPGKGKYAKLVTAIMAYFVYSNFIGVARMLVERGELNPIVGIISVHGTALAIIAVALLLAHTHIRWRPAQPSMETQQ